VWLHEKGRRSAPRFAALQGPEECDVVIVGGGMTGALAALALSGAGVNVCVLEGATVGHGSTAASSALLLQEPDWGM
jgi:glycine/D-amino acid oxidase-like deaminating enzyme